MDDFLKIHHILGLAHKGAMAEAIHNAAHHGTIEYIHLPDEDMKRRRLRAVTDHGTNCAIALPRNEKLEHGAVLLLESKRAIVISAEEVFWLGFRPRDVAAALELGFLAGNMHWRVQLDAGIMRVATNGKRDDTLKRLGPLLDSGKVVQAQ